MVVLVGSHENMQELYHSMTDDPTSGYRVMGYFEDSPSDYYPEEVAYLGQPKEAIEYLERNSGKIAQLYCSLPSVRSAEIVPIINYCENHLVRFFSVPNVRNYLKRRMYFDLLGNVPVLSIRREPLELRENRVLKRFFDIIFSLIFLCTIFPFVYIIIGIAIKISSPGPIFFKQKRSGEDGREFWCYKFRSMRVNAQCDVLQATANDPRKTRIGEFIRKTSIDELPQFINVLMGDMSVVGSQNLLVLPGTQLTEIRSVYSHQQAIAQSETFLKQFHLPATAMLNTAMAAKFVAESGDKTKAAIASAETAALYGLEVLVPRINTDGDNTTRFIVISREKPTAGNRFSLLFTVDNKPGKLAEVIQVIGASGFNMESIKSRPMPHVPFEYYFYVELVGDPTADETGALLHELDRTCRTVRLLGVYTK